MSRMLAVAHVRQGHPEVGQALPQGATVAHAPAPMAKSTMAHACAICTISSAGDSGIWLSNTCSSSASLFPVASGARRFWHEEAMG